MQSHEISLFKITDKINASRLRNTLLVLHTFQYAHIKKPDNHQNSNVEVTQKIQSFVSRKNSNLRISLSKTKHVTLCLKGSCWRTQVGDEGIGDPIPVLLWLRLPFHGSKKRRGQFTLFFHWQARVAHLNINYSKILTQREKSKWAWREYSRISMQTHGW